MRNLGGVQVPSIRSGALNRYVTLQAPSDQADSFGSATPFFEDKFTAWASIVPYTGQEAELARQQRQNLSHMVTIRYRQDFQVTPSWRIKYVTGFVTRYLNIVSIRNVAERDQEWILVCEEVLSAIPQQ